MIYEHHNTCARNHGSHNHVNGSHDIATKCRSASCFICTVLLLTASSFLCTCDATPIESDIIPAISVSVSAAVASALAATPSAAVASVLTTTPPSTAESVVDELIARFEDRSVGYTVDYLLHVMNLAIDHHEEDTHGHKEHEHHEEGHEEGHEDHDEGHEEGHEDHEEGHEEDHKEGHEDHEEGHEEDHKEGHEDHEEGHEEDHKEGHEDHEEGHDEHGGDVVQKCPIDSTLSLFNSIPSLERNQTFDKAALTICAPVLVSLSSIPACHHAIATAEKNTCMEDEVTAAQKWGYGIASVVATSITALVGIAVLPLGKNSAATHQVILFMVALGVSTLICDAILHLIPEALGAHHHSEGACAVDVHDHPDEYLSLKVGSSIICGVMFMYILERIFVLHHHGREIASNGEPGTITTAASFDHPKTSDDTENELTMKTVSNLQYSGDENSNVYLHVDDDPSLHDSSQVPSHNHRAHHCPLNVTETSHQPSDPNTVSFLSRFFLELRNAPVLVWMITWGDGFHNLVDGIAIGAAYSSSVSSGLGTTIAVFLHELPQEFADFAVLVACGLSWSTALLLNFISSLTSLMGLAIGISIANANMDSRKYLLAFTAGMFLYVSFVDMMPQLQNLGHDIPSNRNFILVHSAFLLGFVIMLLIALYGESISV